MTNTTIHLPSAKSVEEWQHVSDIHFLETTPRSVPLSSLISYPGQDYIDRIISLKAEIPAAKHLQVITDLLKDLEVAKSYLVEIYSHRGLLMPISKDESLIQKLSSNSQSAQTALQMLHQLIAKFQKEKDDLTVITQNLTRMLYSESLWSNGQWSDKLIETFCEIYFVLFTIENLQPSKKSVLNDISTLMKISKGAQTGNAADMAETTIRIWLGTTNAITQEFINSILANPNYKRISLITDILMGYLRNQIENRSFINQDKKFQYITLLKFIIIVYNQAYEKEQKDKKGQKKKMFILKPIDIEYTGMAKAAVESYRFLPLIYEYTVATNVGIHIDYITLPKKGTVKNPIQFPRKRLPELQEDAHKFFSILTEIINDLNNSPVVSGKQKLDMNINICNKLFQELPGILKIISMSMGIVREMIIAKQIEAPKIDQNADQNISLYEWAMRRGLTEENSLLILNILWLAKSTKELLLSNYTTIFQAISDSIQTTLQNFAINILPQSILRNQEYKDIITNILEVLRTLLGYFPNGMRYEINAKKASKVEKHDVSIDIGTPHIYLIELLRVQLQLLVNPDAIAVSRQGVFKGQPLDSEDEKIFKEFLDQSSYFIELLDLNNTLDKVCDQSFLYYKEYYLDLNKRTFFPVNTSIPVILSKYALKNYRKLDLTGAIFYPLSIYDDAAATALKYLKSKYLFEEIRAEASICIQYLSREIAQQALNPILKFQLLQFMPKTVVSQLKESMLSLDMKDEANQEDFLKEDISSLRLGVILQQNTLSILGCPIDTKTLISDNLNELIHEKLKALVNILESYGLFFIPMFYRIIEILRRTHELLCSFGLILNPFNDILRLALSTDNPSSLQSLLLNHVYSHIENILVPDCSFFSFPMRVLPKGEMNIKQGIEQIFTKDIASLFNAYLLKTTRIISIESVKDLFWMIEDGAGQVFSLLFATLLEELEKPFVKIYDNVRKNLTRIANPPASATFAQAFDVFEGAYHYFIDNQEIRNCLSLMNQIGNVLMLAQLFDNALILKRTTGTLSSSFILSTDPVDNNEKMPETPEVFELFDKTFQSSKPYFSYLGNKIGDNEILLPFLSSCVRELVTLLLHDYALFAETSPNLCDVKSQKGFAAIFSVLEFIANNVVIMDSSKGGGFAKFVEGIYYFAAVVLHMTNQRRLFRALSIGEKLISHFTADLGVNVDDRTNKFVAATKYFSTSLSSAFATLQPIISSIINK
ncbi:hypothetical protein TVAG_466460 [Trichomonas vaginalis G3]|uniref:CYRIA/CYRIB Rac1 binding domain-containing protein n=1 Tax=Trichomonas vaginalis (strain ATCC PRA-98 / G3) TaxID=412133 RepID=A2G4W8_TRIV3|nr:cytoplasmic FMR1-interacting protein-related family [Trichomonas vaginalis G3]EAX87799.1 hypothetical protein TVAG_466460 [Trichomonas vaginalis G3]KAI5537134.1 cytoplasmic FMR1-interacting protein-related family [Trichomonas vaginalis G3]|eukprot:XP_001300729.1 hypothetical protein [Trichomonas vaginalis G3]